MALRADEPTHDTCRGIAFFLAFDPWRTCKCWPPGSARFFDAAESSGLLSSREAELISHSLIRFGAEMMALYSGSFKSYFDDPRVSDILQHVDDLDHLAQSGLAIADSWVDRLIDACPGSVVLDKQFRVKSFGPPGTFDVYPDAPWLAWVNALDFASIGPWYGLPPHQIIDIIDALKAAASKQPHRKLTSSDFEFGNQVTMPICSRGLQGFVFGIFHDVPKLQREPILSTLLQFGTTMGDVYADLRCRHFYAALDADPSDEQLAREFINVVSPVNRLIVKRGGRRVGYELCHESGYLAGYRSLDQSQMDKPLSPLGFQIAGPYRAEIYVEPVSDWPSLNPEFTRMRLESYLSHALGLLVTKDAAATLTYADAQRLRAEFEAYKDDRAASLAKLRQFYVVKRVEENWATGSVKVTNNELRRFLEHLGRDARNGYQVTSYKADFEKIFLNKVIATSTRNALSLSWNTG